MNLRAIANRATAGVNPNVAATLKRSTGYTTGASGKQTPTYATGVPVTLQVQALTKKDVEHLDALNISNAHTAVYANTTLTPVDRATQSGGDRIEFGSDAKVPVPLRGTIWLVVALLEGWVGAGWYKAALSRQMPGS